MAIGFFWTSVLLCAFVALLAADRMGLFRNTNHFPVHGRVSTVENAFESMMERVTC